MSKQTISVFVIVALCVAFSESNNCDRNQGNEVCFYKTINDNLEAQRNAITLLKRKYEIYVSVLPRKEDRSQYLGNVVNNFVLVRRLTKVWPPLLLFMKISLDSGNEIKSIRYPLNEKALQTSAITCLIRLQETYNIPVEAIANGKLNGTFPQSRFTAEDCFDVGEFYLRKLGYPQLALNWLIAALRRLKRDSTITSASILEHIWVAQCLKGDTKAASFTLKSLEEIRPSFQPTESLENSYDLIRTSNCKEVAKEIDFNQKNLNYYAVHNTEYQRGLCRKVNTPEATSGVLRCRLLDYRRPHLRIRPFKMEEFHLDPPVLMFHDVIYDREIETLIKRYHNRTRYAGKSDYNYDQDTYQDTQYNFYISKDTDVDGLDEKLSKRAGEISNLSMYRADKSNLASYGVAGELKMHRDIAGDVFNASTTSDYATVVYYLTDDFEGGNTIFPEIQLSLKPVKGNALFFFDRWRDLSTIEELVHCGCPVLRGFKWIITKWIHAVGQSYPECGLKKKRKFKHYYLE